MTEQPYDDGLTSQEGAKLVAGGLIRYLFIRTHDDLEHVACYRTANGAWRYSFDYETIECAPQEWEDLALRWLDAADRISMARWSR